MFNKLVIVCASLEEHLRDQLIEKLPDVELMKKLLEVHNTTLEAAMDKVRKWEASREQSRQANGEADSSFKAKGDRPFKLRIVVTNQVRMTRLFLL